LIQFLVSDIAT